MPTLFPELIVDILSRLPVKTLIRFRCVCKSWRALIDGQDFIQMHLKHSIQTKTKHHVIFTSLGSHCIYLIHFDEVFNGLVTRPTDPWKSSKYISRIFSYEVFNRLEATRNNHWQSYKNIGRIFGSCNGLISLIFKNRNIALWNPFTRSYKKLPSLPIEHRTHMIPSYGFGHDHISGDYKVVKIVDINDTNLTVIANEVNVYSLQLNSWKTVQSYPYSGYKVQTPSGGKLVNGALHWLMSGASYRSLKPELLLGFNLVVEEFHVVPLPVCAKEHCNDISLEVLGGCLCVCSSYFMSHVDVWIMKQYGVGESWIKLYSIGKIGVSSYGESKPLEYSKNGEKLLFSHYFEGLTWYDLKEKSNKRVNFCSVPNCLTADMCIESLVSLDRESELDGKKQKELAKKKRLMLKGSSSGK